MRPSAPLSRLGAWLALGCHLIVASGLPLAVSPAPAGGAARLAGKDRSRPFPCMDSPCGCATAEQCFAHCCCHTPAQRLAWGRAHRVEPAVVAALERRVRADTAPSATCCAARRAEASCCSAAETAPAGEAPDVCRDYRSLAADPGEPAHDEPDAPAPRTVILRDMLACGGIVSAWLACGAALPPPLPVTAASATARVGVVALDDDVAASVAADVATPPPRAA